MPITTGLQLYYKFDGNSNDVVNSVNGVDTSITYPSGVINQSANNGGTGSISIAHNAVMNITNNFSISFWFKATNNTQSSKYIISKRFVSIDNNWAVIYEYVNDTVEFYSGAFTGTDPRTGSGITISDTNWHHIVYCYNGTTWEGYKDGVNVFSTSRTFSLGITGTLNLTLFGLSTGNNIVNGNLDELGLWNRKLTSTEVTQLYNSGSGLPYPLIPSSSNFFPFM